MKTHVRALVVGGGAVGTSIAYHLARAGWDDVMLLERDELTSGSTWHAAGLLPYFNMSYATTWIHDHSIRFYKTLEEETRPGCRVLCSSANLRMAQKKRPMGRIRWSYATTAETVRRALRMGLTPAQIKEAARPLVATTTWRARSITRPDRLHQPGRCHHGDGERRFASVA